MRRAPLRAVLVALALTLTALVPRAEGSWGGAPAFAQGSETEDWLVVEGECPSRARVGEEVLRLVPPERRGVLESARVVVRDSGATYHVSVQSENASAERLYDNPERECDRRARFAAVFSVVTLLPPELDEEPVPAASPSPAASEPEPVVEPSPMQAEWGQLEAGVGAVLAPESTDSPRVAGFGLDLQGAAGTGRWAGLLGAEFLPKTSFEYLDLQGELERISLRAGVRHWAVRSPLSLAVELAAVGALDRVSGSGLVSVAETETVFSVGARARVVFEYPASYRVRPYVAAHATWYPATPELVVAPRGAVAELPAVWLGAQAGVVLGFY